MYENSRAKTFSRTLSTGAVSLAALLSGPAMAGYTELLDTLLKNGVINKQQYGALVQKGGALGSAELLDILQKNGAITKDQYGKLAKGKAPAETASAKSAEKPEKKDSNVAVTKIDGKGIRFETPDGNFKFKLNGRLHTDMNVNSGGDIWTYNDTNNNGVPDNGEKGTNNLLTDGTEIRRFRMEFAATFFKNWEMKMQPEFANSGGDGSVGIRDAFIKYTGFDWGQWTVGQSKQPYSLQQMMSSNDMVFMERSIEYEYTNRSVNRALGMRYDTAGENWSFQTGIYGDTATRQTSGTTATADEGYGFSARGTFAPIMSKDTLLHLGASVAMRKPREGDQTVRYRFAQSAIDHVNYIDTGSLPDVNYSTFFDAETAGAWGPLSYEAEYNSTWITSNDHSVYANGFLDGWHFDLAYSLTGESRAGIYDAKDGVFKRLVTDHNFDLDGGWGAWELKARITQANMNNVGQMYQGG